MQFQITDIILWSKGQSHLPRRVTLSTDRVNVISGGSKTGKSAIIPIIDYCLGADRCSIPVETIRDSCSWFGILVETAEGQKLFARREPGGQKSTGDMLMLEGDTVRVPETTPDKNTTADAVKTRLDELSGLSKLSFDSLRTGSGFKGRPSFRDLVAFMFQPQNVVANPDVLFFKADTYEHREKLKSVFPYVLGAVTPKVLAAQHELEAVRRELTRKQKELNNLRQVSEQWVAELRSWIVQAREYGLIDRQIERDATRDELIHALEQVARHRRGGLANAQGISEAIGELVELEGEETVADENLRGLRRRYAEMSKLQRNAERFKGSLAIQRDRLAVSTWLETLMEKSHSCPVCESPLLNQATISELLQALADVEESVQRTGRVPSSFDREMVRVKEDISACVETMKGIALRKSAIEARSQEAQQASFRSSAIARFQGQLQKGLELHRSLGEDGVLSEEISLLQDREQQLSKMVSRSGVTSKKRRALETVAGFAQRILPTLDTERPSDPIELSLSELTIKVKGTLREDFLWEIGSGANWLSYHVAVLLALQQFFIEKSPSPIPSFLVFDQPSQVYFPRRLAGPRSGEEDSDPQLEDEDVEAVRKVFMAMANVVQSASGALQVLVLDHAGPEVWEDIPGVHLVEEWRGDKKLIPMDWLD